MSKIVGRIMLIFARISTTLVTGLLPNIVLSEKQKDAGNRISLVIYKWRKICIYQNCFYCLQERICQWKM